MCGRARCTLRAEDIPRACGIDNGSTRNLQMDRYLPRFNVSPGSNVPVIRREDGSGGQGTVLHCMKWGLIPSFTKKTDKLDHYKMFNARSESICEKASFRRLVPNNRCLVAVEGYYEWKKDGSRKQPYYIHFKDDRPLVFAALFDSWRSSEGEILYTFTIVTTSCSSALQWLHDRMPVILGNNSSIDEWLNGSPSPKSNSVLKPYEDSDLVWYPVTPAMGKPSFDGPECTKQIELKTEEKNLISKFFSKKGVDNEQELKPKIKSSSEESSHKNPSKNLKVEEEEASELPTDSEEDNKHLKFVSSPLIHGEAEKCGTKREYEVLASDAKLSNHNLETHGMSPVKKKANLKNAGEKQPTLFSYFGKN